jgi:hypothetical protein
MSSDFIFSDETAEPKWLEFKCQRSTPLATRTHCRIPLMPHQKLANGASWVWDGNRERPTITPSINCHECWHGFIRNGEFITA